mmetsp:Transcript_1510/g.4552  ORF Transcript_1510/g.4552 Transcript_1510/m.4552 type:complete len:243 (-) Transcript_1510:72-800(-)
MLRACARRFAAGAVVVPCGVGAAAGCLAADGDDPHKIDLGACRRFVAQRWRAENGGQGQYPGDRWYWLDRELSSNVAGETGAVSIYSGALAALRLRGCEDEAVLQFCAEHVAAERAHLAYFERLVPREMHTRLLPAWRLAGYGLGFAPSLLLGDVGLFATVRSVETFVEVHYNAQIDRLAAGPLDPDGRELVRLLRVCCADEVHHKEDAAERLGAADGAAARAWGFVVELGSAAAAEVARRV